MQEFKKLAFVIIGTLLNLTLLSCSGGGGGGGGGGGVTVGGNSSPTIITGYVVDGFVAGATVTAYQVNANGTLGPQIGTPVTTDQNGNYTLNLGTYSGPVYLTSQGGTYTDTVTGSTINLNIPPYSSMILSAIVPNASGNVTVQINPLTTMAANVALTLTGQGIPVATAADAANASVQNYFGLTASILNTALVNLTTAGCMTGNTQPSADVSAILAGISQLASSNGVKAPDLVQALIQDVTSDGLFNGLASGATLSVPLVSGAGTIPLKQIEGTGLTGLASAITTFMTSTSNVCQAPLYSNVTSALSNTNIFTTPDAPTGVSATAGAGTITIGWSPVTRATTYNIYMATQTGVTATSNQRSILNVTSPYVVSAGLITGTTYYFVVTAVSGTSPYTGSESAPSLEVSATALAPVQWAQSVTAGSSVSSFQSVTAASDGSVYAAGYIGNGPINFSSTVISSGTNTVSNATLVKYSSAGAAQWAQTVAGSDVSSFSGVSVASDGSVYAAGYIYGTGTYNFGNGVTAQGTYTGSNIVLVKYNSSGFAQWAQTVTTGSNNSTFSGVSVASDGSVYAAGYIRGTVSYNFGGVAGAITGPSNGNNPVVVKYDPILGTAQWAKTVTAVSGTGVIDESSFSGVSVASDGSVYAAGYIAGAGTTTFTFGPGVTATGANSSVSTTVVGNIVLVKYNSSGLAQWAQTVTSVSAGSYFSSFSTSVSVASDGSVFAAGYIQGNGTYNFGGSSLPVTGTNGSGINVVLVKYSTSGAAQWAQSVSAGSNSSIFFSVSAASDGSAYAAGYIAGTGTFNFGNGMNATGAFDGENSFLVTYDGTGVARWAQTVAGTGASNSYFKGVFAAPDGSAYVAGSINGTGTYILGSNMTTAGTYSGGNIVLARYKGSGSLALSW